MRDVFADIALIGFLAAASCGLYVLSRDPRSTLHRLFFFTGVFIGLFDLAQFLSLLVLSTLYVEMFLRISFVFITLTAASMFHFTYFFTRKTNPPLNSVFYPVLYGSALIVSYLNLTTNLFLSGVKGTPFGLGAVYAGYYNWFAGYVAVFFLADLFLLLGARIKIKKEREKKQYAWIFAGFFSATLFGIIFEIILPQLGYHYVDMLPSASLIFFAFFTTAVVRFGFLEITPSFLAQDIIDTMRGMLIFVDTEGVTRMVNRSFTEKLGYLPNEVIGIMFEKLLRDAGEGKTLRLDVGTKYEMKDIKAKVLKKDNSVLPVNVRASAVADKFGDKIGQLYIMLDVTREEKFADEQKQTIKELTKTKEHMLSILEDSTLARDDLKERISELQDVAKAAEGRELRMMEVEAEVNSLLKELGRPPKYGS